MRRLTVPDEAAKPIPWMLGGGIVAGAAGLFALDLFTPLGNAVSFLYIAVVYLLIRLHRWEHAVAAGVACTVAIVVGGVFSPAGGVLWLGIVHRAFAIAAMWALLAYERQRIEGATRLRGRDTKLNESHVRLRFIIESSPLAILGVDASGRILNWNAGAEHMFGWSEAEAIGHVCPTVPPEGLDDYLAMVSEVVRGETVSGRVRYRKKKDGTRIHASLNAAPFRDTESAVKGATIILEDITERETMQEALRESHRLTRATLDALPGNLCVVDERGTIVAVNEAWSQFAQANGVAPAAVGPGCNYLEVCRHAAGPSGDEAAAFAANLEALLRGERAEFAIEYTCHSDSEKRWFVCRARRFPGEGPAQAVILHTNVTERKLAEEQGRTAEDYFRNLVEALPTMIWVSGRDKSCTYFNRLWLEFRGRTIEQEQGEGWTQGVHPEDLRTCLRTYENAFNARRPFSMEYRLQRSDGEYRWIYDIGHPANAPDGQFLGYVGGCVDITERKGLEGSLRDAHERAETLSTRLLQGQESERQTLAQELHDDIGQVLTAAAINVDRARALCVEPQVHELLDESIAELEQATERVRELALALRPSLLDDLGLAPALEWFLERETKRGGVALDFQSVLGGREVPSDVAIVCYRIAQEAMTNVLRHAQAKQVVARLEVEAKMLRFTLHDDGVAFAVERALTGRGAQLSLGLTSMQERAVLSGGRVEIESVPGRGTMVTLELPLAEGGAASNAET